MKNIEISEEALDAVMVSFWLMLRECENNAKSIFEKHLVEHLYVQWNDIMKDTKAPYWLK